MKDVKKGARVKVIGDNNKGYTGTVEEVGEGLVNVKHDEKCSAQAERGYYPADQLEELTEEATEEKAAEVTAQIEMQKLVATNLEKVNDVIAALKEDSAAGKKALAEVEFSDVERQLRTGWLNWLDGVIEKLEKAIA